MPTFVCSEGRGNGEFPRTNVKERPAFRHFVPEKCAAGGSSVFEERPRCRGSPEAIAGTAASATFLTTVGRI
jgi:hypothetical protein